MALFLKQRAAEECWCGRPTVLPKLEPSPRRQARQLTFIVHISISDRKTSALHLASSIANELQFDDRVRNSRDNFLTNPDGTHELCRTCARLCHGAGAESSSLSSPYGRQHRKNSQAPPTCSVTAQAKSTTVSAKSETSDSASRGWHCYFPFTMEQWVAAVFHVPESLIQVSLQITVRARCVPLSSAS